MAIINALPNTLTNGTTADATQVMADLNQIVNNVNSNAAENGANSSITSLSGLLTPLSIAQGGTGSGTGALSTVFTGVTQSAGDSSTKLATTAFVSNSITNSQTFPFRNRIVNGDMIISQVNGTTAVTPTANSFVTDQWQAIMTQASKLTFQQVVDAPAGFKYSTKITVSSQFNPGATDNFTFTQNIEGRNIIDFQMGTSGAVTIAASNYIKGSVPGTYAVSIRNASNNRSYVGTINVTTNWTQVVITLVGDTTGTWATDNTTGLSWSLDLGSGTNYNTTSGSWQSGNFTRTAGSVTFVNQIPTSTLNITGVQTEKISTAGTQGTTYEVLPYESQLRRCQWYLPAWTSTAANQFFAGGYINTAVEARINANLPNTRAPITGITVPDSTKFTIGWTGNGGGPLNAGALLIAVGGINGTQIACSIAGGTLGYDAFLLSNAAGASVFFTGAQL